MRRLFFKSLYIIAVFIIALLIFLHFSGGENTDQTAVMEAARLPLVRLILPDTEKEVATLHGYRDEMSVRFMRGTLYPVATDRRVRIRVETFGEPLDGLAMEVRDLTGENLVEQSEITDHTETEYGDIEAEIVLKDLLAADTEYMLILRADTRLGPVAFYSRIRLCDEDTMAAVGEAMTFAGGFHDATFERESRETLIPYLESDRTGDNSSFAHVNIHSSLSQVTWGELPIVSHDVPSCTINDLHGDVVSLSLAGTVVVEGEEGRRTVCDVTETFRVRRGITRLYLLDYDREMTARFAGEAEDFGADKIVLGICDENTPLIESEDGGIVCFFAGDTLYSFNKETCELVRLFSFIGDENADERCLWKAHDYQMLRTDASGDVRFLVTGYMNRGVHEGRVGVALYRYDAAIRQLEELSFLAVDVSPDILRGCVRRMSHVSVENDELYLMLGDDVVMLDSAQDKVQTVIAGAALTPYFRSLSGALFARADGVLGDRIFVEQFNTGGHDEVEAEGGTRVMPLSFIQEDLVYGIVQDEDVRRDPAGNEVYAMETVRIRDVDGNILENYHSEGNYVVDAHVDGNQIRLDRVRLNEETGFYEETGEDQIVNTLEAKNRINRVLTVVTKPWEKIVEIDLRQEIDARIVKRINPSFVSEPEDKEDWIYRLAGSAREYYVYVPNGSLEEIFANEADAVSEAQEKNGVVVDGNDRYVWEKKSLAAKNQIMSITHSAQTMLIGEDPVQEPEAEGDGTDEAEERESNVTATAAACLKLMLEQRGINRDVEEMLERGISLAEVLDQSLADCRSLTLKGCELSSVLYYVDQDIPVLVSMRDGNAVLLIGFNESELVIADPSKNEGERVYKITRSQGIRLFKDNGNRFLTYYVKTPDYVSSAPGSANSPAE